MAYLSVLMILFFAKLHFNRVRRLLQPAYTKFNYSPVGRFAKLSAMVDNIEAFTGNLMANFGPLPDDYVMLCDIRYSDVNRAITKLGIQALQGGSRIYGYRRKMGGSKELET